MGGEDNYMTDDFDYEGYGEFRDDTYGDVESTEMDEWLDFDPDC